MRLAIVLQLASNREQCARPEINVIDPQADDFAGLIERRKVIDGVEADRIALAQDVASPPTLRITRARPLVE